MDKHPSRGLNSIIFLSGQDSPTLNGGFQHLGAFNSCLSTTCTTCDMYSEQVASSTSMALSVSAVQSETFSSSVSDVIIVL